MSRSLRSSCVFLLVLAAGIGLGTTATVIRVGQAGRPPGLTTPQDSPEVAWLRQTYGPPKQSQGFEEWIVRDFFRDKRNGMFLDVGAADYKDGSNTWFLETNLGWSGLAVDAQQPYQGGYEQYRPQTRFFTFFVSDRSNDRARLFLSDTSSFVASSQEKFTARFGKVPGAIEVPTITLNDLLDAQGVKSFDFLTMDIELSEPQGLAGLDIQRFKPQLVVVEAHPDVRQQILDYFNASHYAVVGKYLRVDVTNLWFMPEGLSVEPFPGEDQPEAQPH